MTTARDSTIITHMRLIYSIRHIAAATVLATLTTSCSNLPSLVKALAKDPATVQIHFSGWGTQLDFARSNSPATKIAQ